MPPEQFQRVFPFVRDWIARTLAASATNAKPVASFNFPRLPAYYSSQLLTQARVAFVDKCPTPPLSALGLNQFAEFESMNPGGITYLDTYFVLRHEAERESLHFHELVHVVQWQVLGPEQFLALYADGLERNGYRNSPLEVMAYDHEARFNSKEEPYDVEAAVRQQLETFRFYRVLYTPENKLAWETQHYHSGHLSPLDWFRIWTVSKGSLNPADYPARCSTGYYSDVALKTFLKAAKEGRVENLSPDEAKQICEQEGVFAYNTPAGAFGYLSPQSPARRRNDDRYVEFVGAKLDDDKAEGYGSVIARVIQTDGRMLSRAEFALLHHLLDNDPFK